MPNRAAPNRGSWLSARPVIGSGPEELGGDGELGALGAVGGLGEETRLGRGVIGAHAWALNRSEPEVRTAELK